ncbi:MAG TPA: hypothetical protein PLT48_13090 [Nitrospira sp.]|nr:hypothetical protein [Nitrospira sp.]
MTIAFLGIDLAENEFAMHGVDQAGRAALVRPLVRCGQLLKVFPVKPEPVRPFTPTPPCPA